MQLSRQDRQSTSPLHAAARALGRALAGVALASGAINLLMLVGPLFMLQVYDRVLSSRSGSTLVGLCILALAMFVFQGVADMTRARILIRLGRSFHQRLEPEVFGILVTARGQDGTQAVRDLDTLRSFLSGSAVAALFDLPWMPLYAAICFLFHPMLGLAVVAGALLLCAVTLASDRLTQRPMAELAPLAAARSELTEATRRNGLLISALGMRGRLGAAWHGRNAAFLDRHQRAADIASDLSALSRMLRLVLQSGVLALGAWLVINGEATGGVMLAATILTIRALAPIDAAIANWRGFVAARQAWRRLETTFGERPAQPERTLLALPRQELTLANVAVTAPGANALLVSDVTFRLRAGNALAIIGPSGSGKSSLGRALVGAWPALRGVIRLDGATLDQWDADTLGQAVGYLPQDVELFDGSVAQNIARFAPDPDPEALRRAAAAADIHELVLRLPNGYDTQVGDGGVLLSGGQRQRIGLARALYGEPFLIVLDEPNASLDTAGEQALARAVLAARQRGGIVVVIAHRASILAAVDQLMVLNEGRVQHLGSRDEVLVRLSGAAAPPAQAERNAAGKTRAKPATNGAGKHAPAKARGSRAHAAS
ncbi:type I secretion system permease/ATPase [Bosea sp. BK604]|uniref:type I secretion system permease/ATPase n=1 Tax=Bosea sp. BK604 TaxID=2512180 RepID=UPI0010E57374|nr:type I secretion system permease/ATPase [Bosea sp. BK604]TCR66360.1 ATP-binding protein AprD [Bosea sp. BK604]